MENKNRLYIPEDQRQSWTSIAAVWIGCMICVPCLMIGGVLTSGGLSIAEIIISILIGYGLICAYMILIGIQACDTGLPVSQMASGALGETGARYVISAALAIACIGWFGVQSVTCGSSFAVMVWDMFKLGTPSTTVIAISTIIWGAIMVATACFGFKGLKILNYIAVPLLLVVCVYGIISSFGANGTEALTSYAPENSAGLVFGISMVVASFALGGVISGDYCRFAKSRGDVVKSSIVGVLPAGLFMLMTGGIMSIVTGQYDISAILSNVGVPLLGLIALVLATWTTNVTNAYSGGLAISTMIGLDEQKSKLATAIAGGIGTLLAAFGLLNSLTNFLSLISAIIPPLAGVIIANYWIACGGNADKFRMHSGISVDGFVSFIAGAFVAAMTGGSFAAFPALAFLNKPFFVGPVNGIVVSMVLYVVLNKILPKKAD